MGITFVWLALAVAVGVLASNRGRSGVGWFVLSVLLSPLLGLLFCLVAKDLSRAPGTGQPGPATHRRCPQCAEFIQPAAKVCKHCGAAVDPSAYLAEQAAARYRDAEAGATARAIFSFVAAVGGIIAVLVMVKLAM